MNQLTYLEIGQQEQKLDDFWLALSAIGVEQKKSIEVLSSREKEIYRKFENNRRKKEFVGARSVLKNMASNAGIDIDNFQLKKTEQGRPYGVTPTDVLQVSIAHTDRYILCGLSRLHQIGVDLEPVDRKIHHRLRERILTTRETGNARLQPVDTVRIWTIKEAVVKLTGEGLSGLLSEMSIDRQGDEVFSASINGEQKTTIYSWKHLDHWIAVAIY